MSNLKSHTVVAGLRGRAGTALAIATVGASLIAAGPARAVPAGGGSGSGTEKKGCKVTGVNPAGDKSGSTYTVPDGTKVTVANPGGKSTEWTCADGTWAARLVAGGPVHVISPVLSSRHLSQRSRRLVRSRALRVVVRAAPIRTASFARTSTRAF